MRAARANRRSFGEDSGADAVAASASQSPPDHLSRGLARLELRHLCDVGAERGVGLRHHVSRSTEIVEVVDAKAAEVDLQRLENVYRRKRSIAIAHFAGLVYVIF
jgi:hypothetical protein